MVHILELWNFELQVSTGSTECMYSAIRKVQRFLQQLASDGNAEPRPDVSWGELWAVSSTGLSAVSSTGLQQLSTGLAQRSHACQCPLTSLDKRINCLFTLNAVPAVCTEQATVQGLGFVQRSAVCWYTDRTAAIRRELKGSESTNFITSYTSWLLKIEPIGRPETSVRNCFCKLLNIPEECRTPLHRGGSLNLRRL